MSLHWLEKWASAAKAGLEVLAVQFFPALTALSLGQAQSRGM